MVPYLELAAAVAFLAIFVVLLLAVLKLVKKLVVKLLFFLLNSLAGILLFFLIVKMFGVGIPVNVFTIAVAGIFGLAGIGALLLLHFGGMI